MRCPSCDADLPADARFCIECGVTLASASTGPTVHLQPDKDGTSVRCAACGSANPSHAIFCVHCGRRMGDPAAQAPPPRAVITGDVLPGTPVLPAFGPRRRARSGRSRDWEIASIAVFMIGLGLLFLFSRLFWPGILLVIGISNFVRFAGRGQIGVGLRSVLWLFGLAFLFMLPKLFFPGIFVLIALSAILEALLRGARNP
ncbi:MAG: zinc ribbon domain-containing protein [Oscillochloris sp.]|nr:zinc ribbon domain-containing protein [Oscillochloris sp.]